MKQHLREMSKIITELKSAGHILTNEQQVQAVIRSLPQSWEHMKVNMTHNISIKTFQDARHHVELEDERLEAARSFGQAYVVESNTSKLSDFKCDFKRNTKRKVFKKNVPEFKKTHTGNHKRSKRGGKKKDKSNQSCYNYGKLGHYTRECTESKKIQEPQTM